MSEIIGGVGITIEGDYSGLQADFDAALSIAQGGASKISDTVNSGFQAVTSTAITDALQQAQDKAENVAAAINAAMSAISTDGVVAALMSLNENAAVGADGVAKLSDRMIELTGSTRGPEEASAALTQALQEMMAAAQADVDALQSLAGAAQQAGDAANSAANGPVKFSDGAQALIDKQADLDAELSKAISVLSEVHDAYEKGAVSADVLAQAEAKVDAALSAASPNLETVKANVKDLGTETESAADRFAKFAEAMAAVAAAFAFTEGLKALGMAALEAADHVDDATQAITKLDGNAATAQATVSQLRQIASDDALSFPHLLVASQRMTAFLGSSEQVPAIMQAASDTAAMMGISVETAAKSIERFAAGGELSTGALKKLGLTMADMAAVLGTTEGKAKAAFAALDESQKVEKVTEALGKFSGAAKSMSDDALGSFVRLGQQWDQVLEQIGNALGPVLKSLADFAGAHILGPIKTMAEAFQTLPGPVKEVAGGLAIAAAAIVPLAGAFAAVSAAIGPLATVLGPVGAAFMTLATESIPSAITALGVFATETLPAAIAAAAAFATALLTDAAASVANFATVVVPQAVEALGVLIFTTIPAAIGGFGTLATEGITAAAASFTAFATTAVSSMVTSLTEMAAGAIPLAIGALSALGAAAVLAAGAFAGFKLGEWLYNNVGFLRSFGDAVAGAIGKLEDWVTQSKIVAQVLAAMGDQQAKVVLSTIELTSTTQKLADNLAKHGVVIKQGSDSLEAWNEKLVAAAASLGKTGDAAGKMSTQLSLAKAQMDGQAAAAQQLQTNLEAANERLVNAAAAYEKAKASGQGLQQATENLAKAQGEATKAADAITKSHKDMAAAMEKAEAAVASFESKVAAGGSVQKLQKDFENAQKAIETVAKEDLPAAIKAVDDYTAAQERNGAKASVIIQAWEAEQKLIDQLAKQSLPQASDAMLKYLDILGKGDTPLGVWESALAKEEAILQKLAKEDLTAASKGWDDLIAELERIKAPAAVVNQALEDHQKFLDGVAKSADAAVQAQIKLAEQFSKINIQAPPANQALADMENTLKLLGPDLDLIVNKASPANQAMIDFGLNTTKIKTPVFDLKTSVDQLVTSMANLIAQAQKSGDWSPVLTALDEFDKRIALLAKTDLPEAERQMEAWIKGMINAGAPADLIRGQMEKLEPIIAKMAQEGLPGATAAWGRFEDMLKSIPPTFDDVIAKQERLVQKDADLVASLMKQKDSYGALLEAQANQIQEEIKLKEMRGEDANDAVLGLEKVRLKQEELRISTRGLADQYVAMIQDVLKGFDQMAGAMADAIISGKNVGEALVGEFKKIAQSILTDLIQMALLPLKKELIGLMSDLLPNLKGAFTSTSEGAKALSDAAKDAAASAEKMSDAANKVSSALDGGGSGGAGSLAGSVSHLASIVSAIADVISAGAAVASTILLSHISSDTGHIEVNTRAAVAELENARADAWSQFGQMYLRLGEVKNDLDAIKDSIAQLKVSGGGFPDQALSDLNDMAAMAHVVFLGWPVMQGTLQTIAQDIVTWGGYIMSDLDVMVQKLGQLVTHALTANAEAAPATAADVAQAAGQIIDAAGQVVDAVDTSSTDITSAVDSSSTDITAAVGDAAGQTSDAVTSSSEALGGQIETSSSDIVDSVDSTDQSVKELSTTITTSSDGLARVYKDSSDAKGIIAAVNSNREQTTDALLKQLAQAQQIAANGGSVLAQMKALQDEENTYNALIEKAIRDGDTRLADGYRQAQQNIEQQLNNMVQSGAMVQEHIQALQDEIKFDTELMNRALEAGDEKTAEQYRQAAANVQSELLPLLSADVKATQAIPYSVDQLAGNIGVTANASATLVSTAVQGAGNQITTAVNSAATTITSAIIDSAKQAAFTPNPGGTYTNIPPAGTQGGPASSGSNPGVPAGTQAGFGGSVPLPTSGSVPTPTGGPIQAPLSIEPGSFSHNVLIPPEGSSTTAAETPKAQSSSPLWYGSNAPAPAVTKPPDMPAPTGGPTLPGAGAAAGTAAAATPPPPPPTDPHTLMIQDQIAQAQAQLQKDQADLAAALAQMSNPNADQASLTKQVTALQDHITVDQVQIQTLQQQLADAQKTTASASAASADLQQQLKDAQDKLAGDQQQRDKLLTQAAQATDLSIKDLIQKQVDAANIQLQHDQANVEALKQQIASSATQTSDSIAASSSTSGAGTLVYTDSSRPLSVVISDGKTGGTPASTGTPASSATVDLAMPTATPTIPKPPDLPTLKGGPVKGPDVSIPLDNTVGGAAGQSLLDIQKGIINQKPPASEIGGPAGQTLLGIQQAIIDNKPPATVGIGGPAGQTLLGIQQAIIDNKPPATVEIGGAAGQALLNIQAGIIGSAPPKGPVGGSAGQTLLGIQSGIINQKPPSSTTDLAMPTSPATPTTSTTGSGSSYSQPTPDPQTLAFYAGTGAELEDIRNILRHSGEVLYSMRDSWVAFQATTVQFDQGFLKQFGDFGQKMISAINSLKPPKGEGGDGAALPSYDLGGPVHRDMIARLHAGEHVIPPSGAYTLPEPILNRLRLPYMESTPGGNIGPLGSPGPGQKDSGPTVINMPVTFNGVTDGDKLLSLLEQKIKMLIPRASGVGSR